MDIGAPPSHCSCARGRDEDRPPTPEEAYRTSRAEAHQWAGGLARDERLETLVNHRSPLFDACKALRLFDELVVDVDRGTHDVWIVCHLMHAQCMPSTVTKSKFSRNSAAFRARRY